MSNRRYEKLLLDLKAAANQARKVGCTYLHPNDLHDWKTCCADLLLFGAKANPTTLSHFTLSAV